MLSDFSLDQLDCTTLEKLQHIVDQIYADNIQEAYIDVLTIEETLPGCSEIYELSRVKQDAEDIQLAVDMLGDLASWDQVDDSNGIQTYSKGSGDEFFVRGEMVMEAPIFPILALFSEIDLIPTWYSLSRVPRVNAVDLITQPSKFRRMLRYVLDIPWPCSNRDMVISALGVPLEESCSALVVLKSVKDHYFGVDVPQVLDDQVRVDLHIGCINIRCLSPSKSHLTFIVRSDPHVSMIPSWLMNFGIKHFIYYFMERIRDKTAQYEGSEFERRVKANPGYYSEIQDRISKSTAALFKVDS
jgi:hypothetical protein